VDGFTIWNEHGGIEFIGLTDLTGVDFETEVSIVKKSAACYEDCPHKPVVGSKLNKEAIITLNNINVKTEVKLIESLSGTPADHLGYDNIKKVWSFRVLHF